MADNGNQLDDQNEMLGVAVDGELYQPDDFTAREQRELRRVLREWSGHEEASLAALLNFGLADDCDIAPAITYVVKLRSDATAKPEQFEDMDLVAARDEAKKLQKQKRSGRRPPKAATSGS